MRATLTTVGLALLSYLLSGPAIAFGWAAQQTNTAARQPNRAEQQQTRFRSMDRNGDGVITRAEWRGNARSFDRHDRNRDGILSGDEIWTTDQETPVSDRGVPADQSTRAESSRGAWLDLAQVFRQDDRNSDGIISREEWASDNATFARVDSNGDGVITEREFLGEGWTRTVAVGEVGTSERDVQRDSSAYQAGYDRGLIDGRKAGKGDRDVRGWDLEGQRELVEPAPGYSSSLGPRADYEAGYRAGFRVGYRQGFGPRS